MDEVGRRERKKLETRTALHRAALRLVRDSSPVAVTVDDICRAADVSRRTFFNYFATKEDALFLWDPASEDAVADAVAAHPGTAAEAVTEATRGVFRRVLRSEEWADQQAVLHAHPELLATGLRLTDALEDVLARGLARRAGSGTDPLRDRVLAAVAVATARVVVRRWRESPGTDVEDLLDRGFALLSHPGQA